MRITELLEGKTFNEMDFVTHTVDKGKRELNFDIMDDLIFFMNNDDDAYRRHLYPVVSKCVNKHNNDKKTSAKMFADAVKECYSMYINEYPIRGMSSSITDECLKETCKKLHDLVCQHIDNDKYK